LLNAAPTIPLTVEAVAPGAPRLGAAWCRLQGDGAVNTPFLTWEWFSALAESPTLARPVVVLLVNRAGGRTVGLLPVEVDCDPWGLRTVRCVGSEGLGADHLDVVACPQDREAVATAVARHIARELRWDLADFEGLARDGALAAALERELHTPRCLPLQPQLEPVPVVALQGPEAEEVRAMLRRRSARGLKAAERAGGGYSAVNDPAEVGPLLESLMDMHNERWGDQSEIFSTPELRQFHIRAAIRLAAAGMAKLCRLFTAEGDIALEYVLVMGDRAFSYQSGFRPDGGHAPGRTAMCRAMLTAADEGRAEYDLLRGDEAYKADYATGSRPNVRLRALRPTPGAAAWAGRRVVQKLARRPEHADA
jgi:CelD/BcsL family acetyltransferase involved in cellulose biosynthesis